MTVPELRKLIQSRLPLVVPAHTSEGHFYDVPEHMVTLPSVSTCHAVLKDQSLRNFQVNEAGRYILTHYQEFTDTNIEEHIELAKRASIDRRDEAGDIGTEVHRLRELVYQGINIDNEPSMIDIRVQSAIRALRKFLDDTGWIPLFWELKLYRYNPRTKLGVAGMLDDIGLTPYVVRPGTAGCEHNWMFSELSGIYGEQLWKQVDRCVKCGRKVKWELELLDIKTSNQFKDSYWLQVAEYYKMFVKCVGLRPKRVFILVLGKEDGTYQVEVIKDLALGMRASEYAVKLWYAMRKVMESRKPERIAI